MKNIEITKDYTVTKAKADAKTDVMSVIFSALTDIYGEDNVAMVRTGGTSKTNEIGVVIGTASVEGVDAPVCVTINASAKDFVERKTKSRTFPAFDFATAKEEYENYIQEKADKDAEKAAAKQKKIAADKAKREKKAEDTAEF